MFKITFVCSGNLCRSPYAEHMLRRIAPDWVEVGSAGTLDLSGRGSPTDLLDVARVRSVDLSEHRSAALGTAGLGDSDLVLCMARQHVPTAVVDGGARSECTFTLPEFVRHLEDDRLEEMRRGVDGSDDARRLVARIHELRLADDTFIPSEEIDDPIGGPKKDYEAMADRIDDLTKRLAAGFAWTAEGAQIGKLG